MQPEWFIDFAKQLIAEKDPKPPSDEIEQMVIKDICELTRDVVLRDVLASLSQSELKQFEDALDNNDEAAAQAVMADRQSVVTESLLRIRKKYLGLA